MVDLGCAGLYGSTRIFAVIAACLSTGIAQPEAVSPRWLVSFPASPGGKAAESTVVALDDGSIIVAVVPVGADFSLPRLQHGKQLVSVSVIGHDPVSRLAFFKLVGSPAKAPVWSIEIGGNLNANLNVSDGDAWVPCQTTGWVTKVGGKVLPLALLGVSFPKGGPLPGAPLVDDAGQVNAIFFQNTGTGNSGYAIPVEAVHRVKQDICNGGQLERGWLGLALRAESKTPQISRVLPDSPAAAAGILPNDVLLSVGARTISDYADAANAFFYLIPKRPVKVKLLRDSQQIDYVLTPVRQK